MRARWRASAGHRLNSAPTKRFCGPPRPPAMPQAPIAFGLLAPPNALLGAVFSLFGLGISAGFGQPPTSPNPASGSNQHVAVQRLDDNGSMRPPFAPRAFRENMVAVPREPSNTRPRRQRARSVGQRHGHVTWLSAASWAALPSSATWWFRASSCFCLASQRGFHGEQMPRASLTSRHACAKHLAEPQPWRFPWH